MFTLYLTLSLQPYGDVNIIVVISFFFFFSFYSEGNGESKRSSDLSKSPTLSDYYYFNNVKIEWVYFAEWWMLSRLASLGSIAMAHQGLWEHTLSGKGEDKGSIKAFSAKLLSPWLTRNAGMTIPRLPTSLPYHLSTCVTCLCVLSPSWVK